MKTIYTLFVSLVFLYSSGISSGNQSHELKEEFFQCADDSECERIFTHCGGCGCGIAINKEFVSRANEISQLRCANYDGPLCDAICPPDTIECVNNRCTVNQ